MNKIESKISDIQPLLTCDFLVKNKWPNSQDLILCYAALHSLKHVNRALRQFAAQSHSLEVIDSM